MQRTLCLVLAIALIAPLFPFPLVAQETDLVASSTSPITDQGTTTPAVVADVTTPTEPQATTTSEVVETTSSAESEGAEPESASMMFMAASTATGPIIFSNTSTAEPISKIGFSGGAYQYLSQQMTAESSGVITSLDLYVSQYSGGTDRSIRVELYDESGTVHLCSVVNIGESYAPGSPHREEWDLVPFAEAAPELVTLSDRSGSSAVGCNIVDGETYTIKFGIAASSVNGVARLYSAGDAPEDFYFVARAAEEEEPSLPTPPPIVPGTIIAKSADITWDEQGWTGGFAYNFGFQSYIVEDGIVTHIVVPMSFWYDAANAPLYFTLRDGYGNYYNCTTPTKTLTEWGIYNNVRETGSHYNIVTIGPFSGTECDTRLLQQPNKGGIMSLAVFTPEFLTYQNVGGNLGVPAYEDPDTGELVDIPFIVYNATTTTPICTEDCYSNVLFLPGIKGSVLKSGTDVLWPADIFGDDIPMLELDESGESVNTVVVDGILDDYKGTAIYSGLSSYLNGLVNDGTINAWEPMAYDWRFSPEKILSEGVTTENGIVDMVQAVEQLAATSTTGKVTIIGHSMGGLMGKALIKKLEDEGKADLVDNFIMIGTPQLGTPQAVGSLLHGDSEDLLGGSISTARDVRALGQNMKSGYNLLPSRRYFDVVGSAGSPIKFSLEAAFTDAWRNRWSTTTDTFTEFSEFVTGTGVVRAKPGYSDVLRPEVLDPDLLASSAEFHDTFDTYNLPPHIRVVQIAGWGLSTPKTVEYRTVHSVGFPPAPMQGYGILPTVEGDGTVVYPSAVLDGGGESFIFNLGTYNPLPQTTNYEHRDLASVPQIQNAILSVLKSEPVETDSYLLSQKPDVAGVSKQLLIVTRSPVVLGAYDAEGNFTGIRPNQNLSADFLPIIKEIPGSYFFVAGGDHYLSLPEEGKYNFVVKGTGTGPATVEINTVENDVITPKAFYTDMPVTPQTTATFTVDSATTTPEVFLRVDNNGDGQPDMTVTPDGYVPPPTLEQLVASLKAKIQTLDVKPKLKDKLLKKIEKIEKKIAKNKKNRASQVVMKLEIKVNKKATKGKISDADVEEIIDLLDQIESAL